MTIDVRALQLALIREGYGFPRFGPDGLWGRETAEIVARYAGHHGIPWHDPGREPDPPEIAPILASLAVHPEPSPTVGPGRARIYIPEHNSPPGSEHPYDMSAVFRPEMVRLCRLFDLSPGDTIRTFDNHRGLPERERQVLADLATVEPGSLDAVVFCCHGWKTGIQAGFDLRTVAKLAAAIRRASRTTVVVALYCCDTGRDPDPDRADDQIEGPGGDGGFADRLRDELCRVGAVDCRVFGHTVVGHAVRAPWVRGFLGLGNPTGGNGGMWIVAPHTDPWPAWQRALNSTDLRFRFPWMSGAEVLAEITA